MENTTLEIFNNGSKYKSLFNEDLIILPENITNISCISVNGSSLIISSKDSGGLNNNSEVNVVLNNDEITTGKLLNVNGKYVTIKDDNNIVKYIKFKKIVSKYNGNTFSVKNNGENYFVNGNIDKIYWKPKYQLIIGYNYELIINLRAEINNIDNDFYVNTIIFNFKDLKTTSKPDVAYMNQVARKSASVNHAEVVESEDINYINKMKIQFDDYLSEYTNVPLFTDSIKSIIEYYYKLNDKNIYYGIEFDDKQDLTITNYVPGVMEILDNNLELVQQINFEGVKNNRVKILIDKIYFVKVYPNVSVKYNYVDDNKNDYDSITITYNVRFISKESIDLTITYPLIPHKSIEGTNIPNVNDDGFYWTISLNANVEYNFNGDMKLFI